MKSQEIQNIVLDKYKKKESFKKIYKDLSYQVGLSTIKRWCKNIKLFGRIKISQSGRPRHARSKELVKKVKKSISKQKSIRKIAQLHQASRSTVHRILKEDLQLKPYKIREEPYLTVSHLEKRMKFLNWIKNNFKKEDTLRILFSDEKLFDVDGAYNIQNDRIWVVDRNQANEIGGIKKVKKFPQKIMVWLGVCSQGLTPLVIFEKGTINSDSYINKVLPVALKYGNKIFGDQWTFQQDGASCHTSNQTQNWCQENFPDFIQKENWPPNSPDLNPLDYCIWNQIVVGMKWQQVNSKKTLIKEIKKSISNISKDLIQDICQKWYRRVRSLKQNNYKYIN